jgi:hypothetical protein
LRAWLALVLAGSGSSLAAAAPPPLCRGEHGTEPQIAAYFACQIARGDRRGAVKVVSRDFRVQLDPEAPWESLVPWMPRPDVIRLQRLDRRRYVFGDSQGPAFLLEMRGRRVSYWGPIPFGLLPHP